MALADLDALRDAFNETPQLLDINIASRTVVAGRVFETWTALAPVGVAPTTAVVPTNATDGSLGQVNSASTLAIIGARVAAFNAGQYLICDRLSHQGGLSGTVTTAQTTNLPTAALTRHTTGAGVMMGLSIYGQIGSTSTTVTVSYTNQAGDDERISQPVSFGGSSHREVGRFVQLPFQTGDTGVRSVESVTVTATTGTAGNFGVTLFKPLYVLLIDSPSGVCSAGFISGYSAGGIPQIVDSACLFPISISTGTNAQGSVAVVTVEH